MFYGWKGRFIVTSPQGYEHRCRRDIDRNLLPSKTGALRAASILLFGDNPDPRDVARSLESIWLPVGTTVQYVTR